MPCTVREFSEAAGVPALSTTSPWEAFYFGRGANPVMKTLKTLHFEQARAK